MIKETPQSWYILEQAEEPLRVYIDAMAASFEKYGKPMMQEHGTYTNDVSGVLISAIHQVIAMVGIRYQALPNPEYVVDTIEVMMNEMLIDAKAAAGEIN
jgi:hypothetical protein